MLCVRARRLFAGLPQGAGDFAPPFVPDPPAPNPFIQANAAVNPISHVVGTTTQPTSTMSPQEDRSAQQQACEPSAWKEETATPSRQQPPRDDTHEASPPDPSVPDACILIGKPPSSKAEAWSSHQKYLDAGRQADSLRDPPLVVVYAQLASAIDHGGHVIWVPLVHKPIGRRTQNGCRARRRWRRHGDQKPASKRK